MTTLEADALYGELSDEDLIQLAVQHCTRGQKIPDGLMSVLKDKKIDDYFREDPEDED